MRGLFFLDRTCLCVLEPVRDLIAWKNVQILSENREFFGGISRYVDEKFIDFLAQIWTFLQQSNNNLLFICFCGEIVDRLLGSPLRNKLDFASL